MMGKKIGTCEKKEGEERDKTRREGEERGGLLGGEGEGGGRGGRVSSVCCLLAGCPVVPSVVQCKCTQHTLIDGPQCSGYLLVQRASQCETGRTAGRWRRRATYLGTDAAMASGMPAGGNVRIPVRVAERGCQPGPGCWQSGSPGCPEARKSSDGADSPSGLVGFPALYCAGDQTRQETNAAYVP